MNAQAIIADARTHAELSGSLSIFAGKQFHTHLRTTHHIRGHPTGAIGRVF